MDLAARERLSSRTQGGRGYRVETKEMEAIAGDHALEKTWQ